MNQEGTIPLNAYCEVRRVERSRTGRELRAARHRCEYDTWVAGNGETRTRTGDTTIFSRVLYQLSYLAAGGEDIDAAADVRARLGGQAGQAGARSWRPNGG